MCPHANGDSTPVDKDDMVAVENTVPVNGANGQPAVKKRGTTRDPNAHKNEVKNPYAARASDLLSNICNFNIIESTLRGAQLKSSE